MQAFFLQVRAEKSYGLSHQDNLFTRREAGILKNGVHGHDGFGILVRTGFEQSATKTFLGTLWVLGESIYL